MGLVEEPYCLIGHPFQLNISKVINVLTAHAVSHERLANNHESCKQTNWTRPGTEDFPGPQKRTGAAEKTKKET